MRWYHLFFDDLYKQLAKSSELQKLAEILQLTIFTFDEACEMAESDIKAIVENCSDLDKRFKLVTGESDSADADDADDANAAVPEDGASSMSESESDGPSDADTPVIDTGEDGNGDLDSDEAEFAGTDDIEDQSGAPAPVATAAKRA